MSAPFACCLKEPMNALDVESIAIRDDAEERGATLPHRM
jgi:hypothetical protein